MGLREQLELALAAVLNVLGANGWMVLITAIAVSLVLPFGLGLHWRIRRTERLGSLPARAAADDDFDDLNPATEDRILPLGRLGFLILVLFLKQNAIQHY